MTKMTDTKLGQTFSAILCTILFSATCVLSAVGPVRAASAQDAPPVVRPIA